MEIMIVNAQQQVKKVTLEWGGNLKVESGDSIRLANKIDMKTLRKGNDLILQNGKGQEFVMKDFYLKGKKAENQLLSWDDELDQEREISSADSSDSTAVASEDTAAANNSAAADQSAEAGAAKSQDSGKAAGWMSTENGEPGALPVLGGILAMGAIALTASGGGGSSGSGSPINGNLTPAQLALQKIVDYANNPSNPAPTVEDYATAGVTGVTATTLPVVNPAVDAKVGADVDTVAELQAVIDAAIAAQTAALQKIVDYANNNTNPAPTVADYTAAGVSGVTDATLPTINAAVDAKVGADVDTVPELQGVIDTALVAKAALDKIVAYANDNTNPAPTVADYTAAGITGVTATTLPAVNPAVDAKVGTDVDTVAELQALVDAALAAQTAAMNKIVAYANDNTNPAPTVADYAAAGATGVDATTLPAVNPAIDAKVGTDVDTLPELQAVIDAALAAQTTALDKIVAYADDNTNPAPTVADYIAAGITGVDATTLPAVNPAVDAKVGTDVDTVAELQALVDAAIAAQTAAINKIVDYANDNTNPAPTVADYIAAGATGVDATTLPAVNPAVDAVTGLEVDTLPELQAVIDAALAAQTTALQKIVDYANDNTKPVPTVEDYAAAGATGVTPLTLPAVNPAVDAKVGTDVDTLPELQAVIDATLVAQTTALQKIVDYANDNTKPVPTVEDYAAAGATGVDAITLPLVNPAVDAVAGVDVDTVPELQAVINAALEDLLAQLALQKIIDYANDNTKPIPTVEDYANAGVSGVTAANLATVNPAVDAVTGAEVDTVPELQALVDAALATKTAMDKIVAYANDSVNNPAPTVEDYAAAGATGVTATTLPAVNPAVDAVSGVDVDTLPELQAVIDTALAAQATALAKIVAYANDNTNPIPTVADYVAAGATGVNATTLASVNPAVDAVTGLEVDTLPELQAVIDAALATFGLPTATLSQYSYDANTDTLTLIGTKWNTILEVGEDPATTDVSGRLNWDKLSWDWGGNNLLGSPAAGEAFSASHIQNAFVDVSGTTLTVKLTAARASALEVPSNVLSNTIDMQAGFVEDGAGNVGTSSKNDATTTLKTIELGTYGNLINPVMVEGRLYYYWDRSGDGTSSNADHYWDDELNMEVSTGSKYTSDLASIDDLEAEFFGGSGGSVIRDDNRTWIMTDVNGNEITVRLPTYGGAVNIGEFATMQGYQTGTAVSNTTDAQITPDYNTKFSDLLAIWDQFNGAFIAGSGKATSNDSGTTVSGIPEGWGSANMGYLSSSVGTTPAFATAGYVAVNLYKGSTATMSPTLDRYVALEVVL